jgi:cell wall-associated NlpC family hydrolase
VLRASLLGELEACLGIPYRQGGSSPSSGFDQPGFVFHLFRSIHRPVPDDPVAQQSAGLRLPADQFMERGRFREDPPRFRIGDVLFFRSFSRKTNAIVMRPLVYCGDGRAAYPSAAEGKVVLQDIRGKASALAFVQRIILP